MRLRRTASVLGVCALWLGVAVAQQDEGPILKPKAKPNPAGATLLVMCDLACNWRLDGEARGHIDAGGSAKAKVDVGQHVVQATAEDGADQAKQVLEIKSTEQKVVSIEFQPLRDARLKAEREARDKATQVSREDTMRVPQERERKTREQATQQYKEGQDLVAQKRYAEARPFLEQACDGGNMEGCNDLGFLYGFGLGVVVDYDKVISLFEKACNGGVMLGCNRLGWFYQNGLGVAQNYGQARLLYKKACDGGLKDACILLRQLPDQ